MLGAWVTLGGGTTSSLETGLLVTSGIVEAGSFVMLVAGAAIHRRVLVWDRARASIALSPLTASRTVGLTVQATF